MLKSYNTPLKLLLNTKLNVPNGAVFISAKRECYGHSDCFGWKMSSADKPRIDQAGEWYSNVLSKCDS